MKYTFFDVLSKISNWYIDFLVEDENLAGRIENFEDEEEDYFYNEEAASFLHDKIMSISSTDYEEFSTIVSLITLEYFNLFYEEDDEEIEPDEILDEIVMCDKEDFIDSISREENTFLFDMLTELIDKYDFDCGEELDIYYYDNMEYVLKSDIGKNVYREFHPNLLNELNEYKKYKEDEKICKKFDKVKINSLFSYICYLSTLRQVVNDKMILINMFSEKLLNLKKDNSKLYTEILNYIIGYYYIIMDKKQKNNEELTLTDSQNLELLRSNNIEGIVDCPYIYNLVAQFINYDFAEYEKLLNESNENVKSAVKKLIITKSKE